MSLLDRIRQSRQKSVLPVGGATETEIEEKKFRVDDAVAAVKAALSEGIVPGGGVTLVNLAENLSTTATGNSGEDQMSVAAGKYLLKQALEQPFRILLENSGLNPDEWLPLIRKSKAGQGVDVNNPAKLVDLKAKGVVDPVVVTKKAVESASSIAGTAMTMGALVVDVPEKAALAAPDMSGMGGGMGMM
jgi:chaperonin GroEL